MLITLENIAHTTGIYGIMNSTWGWPIVESLHFIGLSILIGTVGVFDLRMLGVAKGVSYADLHKLVPFGVAAYALNVSTGFLFLVTAPDQYLFNPAFQTKLFFMLVAGINMLIFYGTTSRAVKSSQATAILPNRAKVIAAVSLLCWCMVIVCGRLITYYRPPYHWCFWC